MKIKILLTLIAILFVSVLYLLYLNFQKPVQITSYQIPPTPIPSQTASIEPTATSTPQPTTIPVPSVSPSKFGLTKSISLPAVGVTALFPQNTSISLQQEQYYTVQLGASLNTALTFGLFDYDGSGRRAWFQKAYPFAKNYQFEGFSKGYIAYATSPADLSGAYYYFAAVSPAKMLVVDDLIQNGFDLPKFKSFISSITTTTPQAIAPPTVDPNNLFRSSDVKVTIWSDSNLGLKVVGPQWTESRTIKSRDINGNFTYYDWQRSTPSVHITANQIEFIGIDQYYQYINLLDTKYSTWTFNDVANDLLLPSGFCAQEQPRSDVLLNLVMVKEIKIGNLSAQLRSLNKTYSDDKDCRAEDTWLIKAKNGQYITSKFSPEGVLFKLEAF